MIKYFNFLIFPEVWCHSLSHRYFCLVAVQHSHSGKIGAKKKKEFQTYQKHCFTGCHYTWIYKLSFHHLHHNASSFQIQKEIMSSSCSCPVLKDFTGLQKNILNSDDMASINILTIFLLSGNGSTTWYDGCMLTGMVYKGNPNTSSSRRLVIESCTCLWLDIPYIVMIDHQDMPYRVMANFT